MALFNLQRTAWSLQISRTSRTFSVSFTTALPRKHRSKRDHLVPNAPFVSSTPFRSNLYDNSPRSSSRHGQARSAFTSSKVYQEQRAQQAAASEVYRSIPWDLQTPMINYVGRKLQAWSFAAGIKLASTGAPRLDRGLTRSASIS